MISDNSDVELENVFVEVGCLDNSDKACLFKVGFCEADFKNFVLWVINQGLTDVFACFAAKRVVANVQLLNVTEILFSEDFGQMQC